MEPPTVERQVARLVLSKGQKVLYSVLLALVVIGLIIGTHLTLIILITAAILFYGLSVGLKLVIHVASNFYTPPAFQPASVDDPNLPVYTLWVPLYKEANMLASLVQSIEELHYPKNKLQVLLLLEEDDFETQAEAIGMELPAWYEIVVVPDLLPKGKPKALNMGLARTNGVFSVIYDAEDRPDNDQLLKAVAGFWASPDDVACLQARLFFWNDDSSWITRFYGIEYIVHFERVLPGLAKLGLIPPLGGTSNHFRTQALRDVAIKHELLPEGAQGIGGWDPWNVTEDAELAGALTLAGYRVLILDSSTREEATAQMRIADKQRRRWLKGYLKTGLVYTRLPLRTARQMGIGKWLSYNLLMLGTPISLWLNPVFWGLTIVYFLTRSTLIESLFPAPLLYSGFLLLVVGNLLLLGQLFGAALHRERYGSVKYMFMAPIWWAFTSWSAYMVLWELSRKSTRDRWNKTPHGHDLDKEALLETEMTVKAQA